MTKKNVFFVEVAAIIVITLIVLVAQYHDGQLCEYVSEYGHTTEYCGNFVFVLFPLILLIPFSAILYFFRDEVFRAWWNFARWFVPVIIVTTLWLETVGGGGTLGMNNDFTAFILIILYSTFIITSLIKIARGYFKLKSEEEGVSNHQLKKLKERANIITVAIVVFILVILFVIEANT